MAKYKLTLSYDGTGYGGWQVQPNATSIQSLVEAALSTLLKVKTSIVGAGRTDAGVHALGQIAHFSAQETLNLRRVLRSLNGLLPDQIRVLKVEAVDDDFHARFSAIGKVYHYNLHSHPIACPFTRLYSLQIFHTLDLSDLYTAAQLFVGTHDFTSFANESDRGSAAINAVRYLQRIDVVEKENGVQLIFEGNGFLYKMVRNIVGTLLEVCAGKKHIDQIPEILAAKDRKKAGKAAPALGLFLAKVIY